MSSPTLAESQLLDLLEQLKKTTPDAAKQILNSQPPIAYALITMMVNMGAVKTEVFQKILAAYGAQQAQAQAAAQPPQAPTPQPYSHQQQPIHAPVPSHLSQTHSHSQSSTPNQRYGEPNRAHTPTGPAAMTGHRSNPSQGVGAGAGANGMGSHGHTPVGGSQQQQYQGYGQGQGYGHHQSQYGARAPPSGPAHRAPGGPAGGGAAPHQGQASALPEALAAIPEEQKAMILRVLAMTPDQINALPPPERASIMQLRATLGVTG